MNNAKGSEWGSIRNGLFSKEDITESDLRVALVGKGIGLEKESEDELKMTAICFHNPNEENGYLSNWYLSPFHMEGITFSSMEQFMMYKKAITFHDTAIAKQILTTNDVSEIKRLGRLVSQYDDNYWSGIRQIVVYEGLIAKFSQNEDLKKLLIGTGKGILAECAVRDRIWGIGLSMKDLERFERSKWRGQNLLGYTLMLVRDRI